MIKKSEFISVRIESSLKAKVVDLFGKMGLTMSEAITLFLTQVSNTGEIPFPIKESVTK